MSETMGALPSDHPELKAWNRYKESARFANTVKWLTSGGSALDGSLWAAFDQGWIAAKDHFTADSSEAAPERPSLYPAADSKLAADVVNALQGAYHALFSYSYGNASPALAEEIGKKISDVLGRLRG